MSRNPKTGGIEEAKSYMRDKEIPQLFESMMTALMFKKPENHLDFLEECLVKAKHQPKVKWHSFIEPLPPIPRKDTEIKLESQSPDTPPKVDEIQSMRTYSPLPAIGSQESPVANATEETNDITTETPEVNVDSGKDENADTAESADTAVVAKVESLSVGTEAEVNTESEVTSGAEIDADVSADVYTDVTDTGDSGEVDVAADVDTSESKEAEVSVDTTDENTTNVDGEIKEDGGEAVDENTNKADVPESSEAEKTVDAVDAEEDVAVVESDTIEIEGEVDGGETKEAVVNVEVPAQTVAENVAAEGATELNETGAIVDGNEAIETDSGAEVDADVPAEVVTDVSAEVPAELVTDISADVPAEVVADISADVPAEVVADVSADVPAEVVTEASAVVSAEVVTNVSADVPAEVDTEVSAEVPAEIADTAGDRGVSAGNEATETDSKKEEITTGDTGTDDIEVPSYDETSPPVEVEETKIVPVLEKVLGDKGQITHLTDSPNIVLVLGGPGSGKGTQCEKIVEKYGYCHLSTGDLLREEVKQDSERANMLNEIMKKGELVPTDVILELVKQAIESKKESKGFLIDGFPRDVEQGVKFEETVGKCRCLLYFKCSEECMVERLLERAKTSGRADDNIDTIKLRLKTFTDQTVPVVEKFNDRVKEVNAERSVEEIFADVCQCLDSM